LAIYSFTLDFFCDIMYNVSDLIQPFGICPAIKRDPAVAGLFNFKNYMGLPAKRRTTTSKKQRASHFALKKTALATCEKCGAKTAPHKACIKCGAYKGKSVVNVAKRTARLVRSRKGSGKASA